MTDVWVCTNCKSINRQRDTRCYSCGQRQAEAAAADIHTPDVRLQQAVANRAVRGYVPSWPFAVAAGALIVLATLMGVWLLLESVRGIQGVREAFLQAIQTGDSTGFSSLMVAEQQRLLVPSLVRSGLQFVGVIAFGLWLSRVNLNIPALGGGVPSWGPIKALLYPLIPIVNVFRVPVFVQDAMYRLDPKAGGFLMVMSAFLLVFGSWLVGTVGGLVIGGALASAVISAPSADVAARAAAGALDQTVALTVLTELMTAAGALLLVVIVGRVESRAMARDREIRTAFLGTPDGSAPVQAPVSPAAPAAIQDTAPPPATGQDAAPVGYQPQASVPVYRPQPVAPPTPVDPAGPAEPPLPPPPPA